VSYLIELDELAGLVVARGAEMGLAAAEEGREAAAEAALVLDELLAVNLAVLDVHARARPA
jgi:hypothetical protein